MGAGGGARHMELGARYEVSRLLGAGCFGCVFLAEARGRSCGLGRVAIKRQERRGRGLSREFEVLDSLQRVPHCLQMLDCFFTVGPDRKLVQNLIFEYLEHDLEAMIAAARRSARGIPEARAKLIAYQLFKGLQQLHARGVVHRDLKPENVLVSAGGLLKIGDFGSAKFLAPGARSSPYVVARYYRAPELFLGLADYGAAVDVWAAGCVLAELFCLEPLFRGRTDAEQLLAVFRLWGSPAAGDLADASGLLARLPGFDRDVARLGRVFGRVADLAALMSLLGRCFDYSARRRVTADEALRHPFFAGVEAAYRQLPEA